MRKAALRAFEAVSGPHGAAQSWRNLNGPWIHRQGRSNHNDQRPFIGNIAPCRQHALPFVLRRPQANTVVRSKEWRDIRWVDGQAREVNVTGVALEYGDSHVARACGAAQAGALAR